jgi:hypothetical protein
MCRGMQATMLITEASEEKMLNVIEEINSNYDDIKFMRTTPLK